MAGSNETSLYVAGSLRRAWRNAGTPSNGTAGTYYGVAEPGDLLIDTTYKRLFQNIGSQASPTWAHVIASGPITVKTANCFLTAAEAGVVLVNQDNIYVYLPTYVDNAYLSFIIKGVYTYVAGVTVRATLDGGKIDGADYKRSTLQYNALHVIGDGVAWRVISSHGTWV